MSTDAFIGLGSNLGDRSENLERALLGLERLGSVVSVSSICETAPHGGAAGPAFLNGVVRLRTDLPARQLLVELQRIEQALGRERPYPLAPRTIDLDLLLYGSLILDEEGLQVPHPRLHLRPFVLRPLAEIAPDTVHPRCRKSLGELATAILG